MMPRLALPLLLLLAPQDPATDVVVMKDGTEKTGFIAEETDAAVVLQVLIKGSKGETIGSAKSTIAKESIAEIRRMSPTARAKALGRATAFEDRGRDRRERRAKIVVAKATVAGQEGLYASGDHFEIFTTSDEEFARDACDAMQQMAEGYLQHFKPRKKAAEKVRVTILADRRQYDEYLTAKFGGTVGNPALFLIKEKVIVAYNCVQKEEAAAAKTEIQEYQKRVETFRRAVAAEEARVDKAVRDGRQAVIDWATEAKNQLRKANPSNLGERLQEIDRVKDRRLEAIKVTEKQIDAGLDDYRKKANAEIAQCEQTIRKNNQVLREQNRVMFETLFHEGFHAFAQNRLFTEKEIPRWLNEGMAAYYEMSVVEAGELVHGAPHPELLRVFREQRQNRTLPRLAAVLRGGGEMFLLTHKNSVERSNGAYAVSWALAHYLIPRVSADQMESYVTEVAGGKDPVEALGKVLGKTADEIEDAMIVHAAGLKSP
jgi:hypothetical protein